MKADVAFTVHHDTRIFTDKTGVPFHRIMWSANEDRFKNYGGEYKYDLFFSGVTRPEQAGDLRSRVLSEINRLDGYKNFINNRSHKNNYRGKIFSDEEYSRHLSDSKLCLVTTGPADLVGTRYFEIFAGNKSLVLCNRMDEKIYGDYVIDGVNCVMFSTVDEFYEKALYYLNHEEERMEIVNQAHDKFISSQTWSHTSKTVKQFVSS